MFMASVRKYTRARKLTPRMLNELIEKIEVHQSEKIDGKTVRAVENAQRFFGIPITGVVDLETWTLLFADFE